MALLLFLVLMLGVGLGTAAGSWATRRPEFVLRTSSGFLAIDGTPSPRDLEKLRSELSRVWGVDLGGAKVPMPGSAPEGSAGDQLSS